MKNKIYPDKREGISARQTRGLRKQENEKPVQFREGKISAYARAGKKGKKIDRWGGIKNVMRQEGKIGKRFLYLSSQLINT